MANWPILPRTYPIQVYTNESVASGYSLHASTGLPGSTDSASSQFKQPILDNGGVSAIVEAGAVSAVPDVTTRITGRDGGGDVSDSVWP